MYFNTREYDRMNALSLMSLVGVSLSLVYLVCIAVTSIASSQHAIESSTASTHMWLSFILVMMFVAINLIVAPRYERLYTTKELIDGFRSLLDQERGDGILKLTPEVERAIVITATRKADGYCVYIQGSHVLYRLDVAPAHIVVYPSTQCSTEEFARSVLAFLNGDQFSLRRVLERADGTVAAS